MADPITGYLAPPANEEEMRALAERLRGRKLGGQVFSLSGDPVLRGMGEASVKRADDEAQQSGMLIKALAERQQREAENQLNRDAQMNQMEEQQRLIGEREIAGNERAQEQWRLEQDAKKPTDYITPDGEIKQAKVIGGILQEANGMSLPPGSKEYNERAGSIIKPAAGITEKYMSKISLDDAITGIISGIPDLGEEALKQLNNTKGDAAVDMTNKMFPFSTAATDLAARNLLYTDEDAQATMEKFSRLESEVLKLISGKQITGIEANKVNKWSPNAAGLTLEARVRRAQFLQDRIRSEMGVYEMKYPDFSLRQNVGDTQIGGETVGGGPVWTDDDEAMYWMLKDKHNANP